MLTKDRAHEIFARLLKHSSADETEVILTGGAHALTRFANNTIHQNVAEESSALSVRVVVGGRTARASTNKLDDASIRRTVKAAEAMAKVQQPDPDLLPMATPAEAGAASNGAPSRYFDSTAAITPEARAQAVRGIVDVAAKNKLTAAGIYSTSQSVEAILNSRGLFQFHQQTSSEISITMLGRDSSGWQKANSPDARNLDPATLAETAARKACDSAAPRELAPGKHTV
ncbi:MAG: PmbA/TldA family metallopeptidase, partial [Terriglobales bacterium]